MGVGVCLCVCVCGGGGCVKRVCVCTGARAGCLYLLEVSMRVRWMVEAVLGGEEGVGVCVVVGRCMVLLCVCDCVRVCVWGGGGRCMRVCV